MIAILRCFLLSKVLENLVQSVINIQKESKEVIAKETEEKMKQLFLCDYEKW